MRAVCMLQSALPLPQVLLLKAGQQKRMNLMVETSGRDVAMFEVCARGLFSPCLKSSGM